VKLRTRLTLGFAAGMAVVLAALGFFLDWRVGHDLTAGIDMDLRSRGQVIVSAVRSSEPDLIGAEGRLIDPDEAFAQVLAPPDRIVDSSSAVRPAPMLSATTLRAVTSPTFSTARVRGVDDPARLLAIPVRVGGRLVVVVVGATLGDRNEAVARLRLAMAIGGPAALALVSLAGWALAGAALRPVESMRREAAAISSSEPSRRLPVAAAPDELARLGSTLNAMLDRLQESMDRERRFLDRASHELRTPLTVLRMELDLALSRARSPEELRAALTTASEETDRLVRLAEDLLVLNRAKDGRLPVERRDADVAELVRRAGAANAARAEAAGVELRVEPAPGPLVASVDPDRIRQALDDLVDNAFRHGASGGTIVLAAVRNGDGVRVSVQDDGPGYPQSMLDEPDADGERAGLGLEVARAIAEGHGGRLVLENVAGRGARATVMVPGDGPQAPLVRRA
jgi:two-component system, OmpR family, sensor kinase